MLMGSCVRLAGHKTRGTAATTLPSTGRCLFARALAAGTQSSHTTPAHPTSTHAAFQGDCVELIELTPSVSSSSSSSLSTRAHAAASAMPLSLAGNSYYAQRYGPGARRPSRSSHVAPSWQASTLSAGDVVVHALRSVAPRALRQAPMVDVTGVRTSYIDASERDPRYLQTVDGAIHSMHLHDGAEVPALRRGDVATGQLAILAAWDAPTTTTTRTAMTHLQLCPVENAALALLGRRGTLTFRQEEEGLQMARRLAEAYARPRSRPWSLRPVYSADGHLLAFRLV